MNDLRIHFQTGRIIYGLVPIIAGLDKFTNLLADWPAYLSPALGRIIPVDPQTFMYVVGIVEIAAGLLVLSPLVYYGALLVGAWLIAISLNLVIGGFYDIAVRDLVMSAGAFYVAGLARRYGPAPSQDISTTGVSASHSAQSSR